MKKNKNKNRSIVVTNDVKFRLIFFYKVPHSPNVEVTIKQAVTELILIEQTQVFQIRLDDVKLEKIKHQ